MIVTKSTALDKIDRFSVLSPIGLDRIFQTLEFLFVIESKIETCEEIWIKLDDAVLFSDMRVGPAKLLINFTRPNMRYVYFYSRLAQSVF